MILLRAALHELLGLFVDDEFLALATLGVVALTALIALEGSSFLLAGAVLLIGCLLVLVTGVIRTARNRS